MTQQLHEWHVQQFRSTLLKSLLFLLKLLLHLQFLRWLMPLMPLLPLPHLPRLPLLLLQVWLSTWLLMVHVMLWPMLVVLPVMIVLLMNNRVRTGAW